MEKDVLSFYKITCSDNITRYYPNIPLIKTVDACSLHREGHCYMYDSPCCKLEYRMRQVHLAYWIDPGRLSVMAYEGLTYARVCPECGDFVIIDHRMGSTGTLSCRSITICSTCDLSDWQFGRHSCNKLALYEVHRAYIYNEFSYLLDHVGRIGERNGNS